MYNLFLILHIIVAGALVGIILIQRGRSGGLVEALGGVESIFGTKTNAMLVRVTIILSVLFFSTSIILVFLSKEQGRSLMERVKEPVRKEAPKRPSLPAAAAPANVTAASPVNLEPPQNQTQPQAQNTQATPQSQAQTVNSTSR